MNLGVKRNLPQGRSEALGGSHEQSSLGFRRGRDAHRSFEQIAPQRAKADAGCQEYSVIQHDHRERKNRLRMELDPADSQKKHQDRGWYGGKTERDRIT